MLSFLKRERSKKLENQLNTLQKEGPAAWADLPEDGLFTPAGFHAEQAEATACSNYSYWGSTFRAFFKNKAAVALLIALVAVVAIALGLWVALKPQAAQGEKTITVNVVFADGTQNSHTISTSEEYLRGALEQAALIAGEEGEYGLFVKTVDGVTANDANQEWWCFTKGGETLETGVDSTPIADGDTFEITLTQGY